MSAARPEQTSVYAVYPDAVRAGRIRDAVGILLRRARSEPEGAVHGRTVYVPLPDSNAASSEMRTGFTRCASKPAMRARTRSSSLPYPVTASS